MRVVHFLSGRKFLVSEEELETYKKKVERLSLIQGNKLYSDVCLSDDYVEAKRDLERYISSLTEP